MTAEIKPFDPNALHTAPKVVIAPFFKDSETGATYVHQDLVKTQEPWAEEAHIPPMRGTEKFGDVESFVDFVKRYANSERSLLTWSSKGLFVTLDYADAIEPAPGRCQWRAEHPFVTSRQWRAWMNVASGQAVPQRVAVERLEDLAEDIVEPAATDLMNIIRSLKASANAKAETEIRPDGTTAVTFAQDTAVRGKTGDVTLPQFIFISIPVLKGHLSEAGKPVLYRIPVRVRVSVDEVAHLAFRFSIPNAEQVLEATYEDRVTLAKSKLGDDFELLRAAD
jgi:hypothetical protein